VIFQIYHQNQLVFLREKMVKSFTLLILFVLNLFTACSRKPENTTYIALVGDRKILVEDYIDRFTEYLKKTGVNDNLKLRHDFLNMLIDEAVLLEYARVSNLIEEPRIKTRLQNKQEQLYLDYYYEKYIYPQLTVSETELREAFRRSKIKIRARHLYARTLEDILEIEQRLAEGKSFESLARKLFNDPVLSSNGGDLGWFSFDEMDPNFEDGAYSMQIGETSNPVKTNDGYSIIQVLDIQSQPFITESDYVKNEKWLLLQVKRRKHARFLESKTDEILSNLDLRINDQILEDVYEELPKLRNRILTNLDLTEMSIKSRNDILLSSINGEWTIQQVIFKLAELNKNQWNRIIDQNDLVEVLKGLVIREEIEKRIAAYDIPRQPQVIKLIEKKQNEEIIAQITEYIRDTLTIKEEVIQDYYEAHTNEFVSQTKYKVAEIAVEDSILAWHVASLIAAGEDFSDMAKSYSENERSASRGGYIGWGEIAQFGKLSDHIAKSQVGDVVGPFKYYDKFILVKLLEIRKPSPLNFEDSKDKIAEKLKPDIFKNAYFRFINEAKTLMKLEIKSEFIDKLNIDIGRGMS